MGWIEKKGNRWRVGYRKDGRQHYKYFEHKADAESFRQSLQGFATTTAQALDRLAGKAAKSRSPKLADYARDVIKTDREGNPLSAGSREGYDAVLRNHLDGSVLGSLPIADITPLDIRTFWSEVAPKKVYAADGSGAKGNVYRLLAKAFNAAVVDGIIPSSPLKRTRGVGRPSKKRRATKINPLTVDQIEQLAAATGSERDRLCILVAGFVGLRAGEVGGLRVRDLDAKRCTLTISQAVVRTRGSRTIGPTKTEESDQTLTIPCSLAEELAAFVKENGAASDGRIFYTPGEGLIDHIILNKVCQRAARKAKLGPVHFHELRHACASLLIDAGANPKAIQAYLRHSSIEITFDTYGHLFPKADQALADSMQSRREDYAERIKALAV